MSIYFEDNLKLFLFHLSGQKKNVLFNTTQNFDRIFKWMDIFSYIFTIKL